MATFDSKNLRRGVVHAGTWGNRVTQYDTVTIPGDASVDDVARFIELPRGAIPVDLQVFIDGEATGGEFDLDFGLQAKRDGELSDSDYFMAGQGGDAAARVRADEVNEPVELEDDDYYLTATVKGASPGAATDITAVVEYIFIGTE